MADGGLPGRLSGCTAALRFWEGGFVFYGGVVATGMVLLLFCRHEGWSFWRVGDLAAPTLAIGHGIGRLGCFFAGCCFGKACPTRWGVTFGDGSVAYQELQAVGELPVTAMRTPPLHATQLYEAVGELVLFALLLILRRRWRAADLLAEGARGVGARARQQVPGGLILVYVGGYAVLRFVVEIFRGDFSRRFVGAWNWPWLAVRLRLPPDEPLFLSVSQLTSLVMLIGVVAALLWRRKLSRSVTAAGGVPR